MCDCYEQSCLVCGKGIPVHLADYKTGRDEVFVIHEECFEKIKRRFTDFEESPVLIISLTGNALSNADGNYPNY